MSCLPKKQVKKNRAYTDADIFSLYEEIQRVYLEDKRPWLLGYSGGKDSTTTLQLVWYALQLLPPSKRTKTINVLSSDTLVENPLMKEVLENSLTKINEAARREGIPINAELVEPVLNDTFWVNLLGKGYPAPQRTFRWCTDRLKIYPANRYILDKIDEYGEVIVVLGIRKSESATRAQTMSLHAIENSKMQRHSSFPQAYVYAPIQDFKLDDVWHYLLRNPNPWGSDNEELFELYKNAQSGECPLVVDSLTPPCGGSRFGCWVCTLVDRDKTMEALIASGDKWLTPLVEYRNLLMETQDPEKKSKIREYKSRQGYVRFKSDNSGKISYGPIKLEYAKFLLKKLLEAQQELRKTGPDPNVWVISPEELHEIRRLWRLERGDWEDSVPTIYKEVVGEGLDWIRDDLGTFTGRELALLGETCERHDVPARLVSKLLDVERQMQGMAKRSSIYNKIDSIFKEEWRTEQEVIDEWHKEGGSAE